MPTITKGEPGKLTTQSASARCVLGLSFNVLSRPQEIEHSCQCQPNQRSPLDQVARIQSADVQRVQRQQRCYCQAAKPHNDPTPDNHAANRAPTVQKYTHTT